MTTKTTRFETKAEAFEFSVTEGGIIHRYGPEFYVVDFANMEWAFSCGMRVEDDFSDLMG